MNNNSIICVTLKEKLEAIWNNHDFVFGVIDTLKTDENRAKMIKILDIGLVDTDKIILIALGLNRGLINPKL